MTRRSLLLLLLIGILMGSCAPSGAGGPTPDINATIAANAETMVAALFQTQTALAPVATNTAIPTITPLATTTALTLSSPTTFVQQPVFVAASATPTGPTSTPISSSLGVGCRNLYLIRSYTSPEGPFNPGQEFTQYWQVENNGTCDWMYVFEIVFDSGDKLGGSPYRFGKKITPNNTTTLSVDLDAPNKSGTYSGTWRMSDGGTKFGAGLPVSIKVGGPTNTPKPDTSGTAVAQTVVAGVALTNAAIAQQTAVQAGINTAVAGTLTADANTAVAAQATNACNTYLLTNLPPCPP